MITYDGKTKVTVNDYDELAEEALRLVQYDKDDWNILGVLGIVAHLKCLGYDINVLYTHDGSGPRSDSWNWEMSGDVYHPNGFPCELVGVDTIECYWHPK